ncbi:hypothetical protein Tcan_09330 [Toxocara canis]|uniref:Uncharacterized protein n=1 Tax=Toxocara canis TaxID=6265 RepID=A0A0B2VYJ0_TOXCA|nr:hypothetical protein Tcan_09330 [Toxocara canis]
MDAAEVIRTVMRVLELFVAVRERAGAVTIRDAAVKLAALADSHDCSATKEKKPSAELLAKDEDELDIQAVLFDCLNDPEVHRRVGAVTGSGVAFDDVQRYVTVVYSTLSKGILMSREHVQKIRDCVEKLAVKIDKLKTENREIMQKVDIAKKQLERKQVQHRRVMDERVKYLERKLAETESKHKEESRRLCEELRLNRQAEKKAAQKSKDDEMALINTQKHRIVFARERVQGKGCSQDGVAFSLLAFNCDRGVLTVCDVDAAVAKPKYSVVFINNTISLLQMKMSNVNLRSATERARKAELMLLQLKLDVGVRVLEDALNDTERCICEIEMKRRMMVGGMRSEELQNVLSEWHARRSEIAGLISSAKSEFAIRKSMDAAVRYKVVSLWVRLQCKSNNTGALSPSTGGLHLSTDKAPLLDISFPTLWKPSWEDWFGTKSIAHSQALDQVSFFFGRHSFYGHGRRKE